MNENTLIHKGNSEPNGIVFPTKEEYEIALKTGEIVVKK